MMVMMVMLIMMLMMMVMMETTILIQPVSSLSSSNRLFLLPVAPGDGDE